MGHVLLVPLRVVLFVSLCIAAGMGAGIPDPPLVGLFHAINSCSMGSM
jgi:hypothetical protein